MEFVSNEQTVVQLELVIGRLLKELDHDGDFDERGCMERGARVAKKSFRCACGN
jgi:hypothetical protein